VAEIEVEGEGGIRPPWSMITGGLFLTVGFSPTAGVMVSETYL
jgi:hypothetical protein